MSKSKSTNVATVEPTAAILTTSEQHAAAVAALAALDAITAADEKRGAAIVAAESKSLPAMASAAVKFAAAFDALAATLPAKNGSVSDARTMSAMAEQRGESAPLPSQPTVSRYLAVGRTIPAGTTHAFVADYLAAGNAPSWSTFATYCGLKRGESRTGSHVLRDGKVERVGKLTPAKSKSKSEPAAITVDALADALAKSEREPDVAAAARIAFAGVADDVVAACVADAADRFAGWSRADVADLVLAGLAMLRG